MPNQNDKMNICGFERDQTAIVLFSDNPIGIFNDSKNTKNPLTGLIFSHGNYKGALGNKLKMLSKQYEPNRIILENISLDQVIGALVNSQRAKKASKKDAGEKKGPKAAKTSKNPSEKVRVSK
jgi:hypothetical protein